MQKYSIKAVVRADKQNQETGLCPVIFQVILNKKVFKYTVDGCKVHPNWWDKKKGQVDISKLPKNTTVISKLEYQQFNHYLEDKCAGFKCFMRENDLMGRIITQERIDEYFKQGRTQKSFFEFWDESVADRNIRPSTIESYADTKKILKDFRPKVEFEDIDKDFIGKFDKYLEIERGNTVNGRFNRHKNLKAILTDAVAKGLIKLNPYIHRENKIKFQKTHREFLELSELIKLKNLVLPPKHLQLSDVKDMLLFCCYTSLRYSDMQDLRWEQISFEGGTLEKIQVKTSTSVHVKLIQPAIEILKRQSQKKNNGEFVFKRIENQSINRSIKTLVELAGIKKKISFHCARHTFAMLHLELGTDLYQIKDLLVHSNVTVTQVYVKNKQRHLNTAMLRYEQMLSSN